MIHSMTDKEIVDHWINNEKHKRDPLVDHPGATEVAFIYKGMYCTAYRDRNKVWKRILTADNKLIVIPYVEDETAKEQGNTAHT